MAALQRELVSCYCFLNLGIWKNPWREGSSEWLITLISMSGRWNQFLGKRNKKSLAYSSLSVHRLTFCFVCRDNEFHHNSKVISLTIECWLKFPKFLRMLVTNFVILLVHFCSNTLTLHIIMFSLLRNTNLLIGIDRDTERLIFTTKRALMDRAIHFRKR